MDGRTANISPMSRARFDSSSVISSSYGFSPARGSISRVEIAPGSSPWAGATTAIDAATRSDRRATGILKTKTSPPRASPAARIASSTARFVLITNRVIAGSVTVTGPPAAIWRKKSSSAEPREPRTFPNRTLAKVVGWLPR